MICNERKGRLKSWDDAKGFGFIQPLNGGAEVFAHISVMRGDRRPQPGDEVLFIEGRDERGRPRAEHLRLAGELSLDRQSIRRKPKAPGKAVPAARKAAAKPALRSSTQGSIHNFSSKAVVLALLCVLPLLGAVTLFGKGGWWVLPLYLLASLLSVRCGSSCSHTDAASTAYIWASGIFWAALSESSSLSKVLKSVSKRSSVASSS